MNKKVFSFILAVVVLSLLDSVVAFAIENDGAFDSYSISIQTSTRVIDDISEFTIEQQDGFIPAEQVYLDPEISVSKRTTNPAGALPETQEELLKNSEIPEEIFLAVEQIDSRASWCYLDNTYYVYNQINNSYCGPACVQSVLRYLTGSTPSQSVIANACYTLSSGTRLSEMQSYTNNQQSQRAYNLLYNGSELTMKTSLYAGIALYDAPSIIGVSFSEGGDWPYTARSDGHFVTVYGVKSDKSSFALGDPWIGYMNVQSSWSYSVNLSELYNAYSANSLGLMY